MRDLLFFTFFYLCLRNPEFQDKLQTGRSILVFGNDLQLKLCQATVVWPDPASQGSPHHLLPSPGQPTRLCWPMQRHIELLAALEPLPSHLLARGVCKATWILLTANELLTLLSSGWLQRNALGRDLPEDLPRLVCLWKNMITGKGKIFSGWVYRLWNTLCLLIKAVTANLFKGLTQEKSLWPRVVKWEWLWTPCPNVQPLLASPAATASQVASDSVGRGWELSWGSKAPRNMFF